MLESIGEHVASDGYRIRSRHWTANPVRGTVVALHGIQSHSGWYGWSSERLARAGWEVVFLDRRGSGLNDADRGHARAADRLVNDVATLLRAKRPSSPLEASRPLVLLGVSWGGRLAACVAARHPELVDGLALLTPGICAQVRPTWSQRWLLRLAMFTGDARRTAPIPLDDPALFTSRPEWQTFIRDDPLALREATTGFFAASAALEREARDSAGRIECPTLLMLAGRDRIIDNARTWRWFKKLAARESTLVEFRNAAHTLEFEPDRERFLARLLGWLSGIDP